MKIALDTAESTLADLDRRCCDGGRSPRLEALATKLAEVRRAVEGSGATAPTELLPLLEEAGAMVGALQVGCCAPNRLPLYARLLEQLNVLQQRLAPMH